MNIVSSSPLSLNDSRTAIEEAISELRTVCFGFKLLTDVSIDSEFFESDSFNDWLGLLFHCYDSFHAQVNTLATSFDSLCDGISELKKVAAAAATKIE